MLMTGLIIFAGASHSGALHPASRYSSPPAVPKVSPRR